MRWAVPVLAALLTGCLPTPAPSAPAPTPRPTVVGVTRTVAPTVSTASGVLNLYASPGATVWVLSLDAPDAQAMEFVASADGTVTDINLPGGIYQAGVTDGDRRLYATDLVLQPDDDLFVNLRVLTPGIKRTCIGVDPDTCREAVDEAYMNGLLGLAPGAVVLAVEARGVDEAPCDGDLVGIVQVKFSVAAGSLGVVVARNASGSMESCPF